MTVKYSTLLRLYLSLETYVHKNEYTIFLNRDLSTGSYYEQGKYSKIKAFYCWSQFSLIHF